MRYWPFIEGQYLARGVDLRELFERLDGTRTYNVVDALLEQDFIADAMLGQDIDLEKIRAPIIRVYQDASNEAGFSNHNSEPTGLHAGKVLEMDDDGLFGLGEQPLTA